MNPDRTARSASRRAMLGALAAAGAVSAAKGATGGPAMTNPSRQYLLVHGTSHGGWCWRHVADYLTRAGHRVFAPTLTGLGERAHLRSPEVGLATHIDDVVGVAEAEELDRFILVGHSYGGYVITGVCDRMRERIAHVVYIDAPNPKNGASNAQGRSPEQLAESFGPLIDGYLLPVRKETIPALGIPPENQIATAWLQRRLTPQPIKTWTDPIQLFHGGSEGLTRTYVFCNAAAPDSPLRRNADRMRMDPTWNYRELPCGHDAMIALPRETSDLLLSCQ
jgi:pimeloyl-ACP methyl ester carboxylesterase